MTKLSNYTQKAHTHILKTLSYKRDIGLTGNQGFINHDIIVAMPYVKTTPRKQCYKKISKFSVNVNV